MSDKRTTEPAAVTERYRQIMDRTNEGPLCGEPVSVNQVRHILRASRGHGEPPRYLQERYWCGCIREARWAPRCDQHSHLDHGEKPSRQSVVAPVAPVSEPTLIITDRFADNRPLAEIHAVAPVAPALEPILSGSPCRVCWQSERRHDPGTYWGTPACNLYRPLLGPGACSCGKPLSLVCISCVNNDAPLSDGEMKHTQRMLDSLEFADDPTPECPAVAPVERRSDEGLTPEQRASLDDFTQEMVHTVIPEIESALLARRNAQNWYALYAAWRKRAEEAEAELTRLRTTTASQGERERAIPSPRELDSLDTWVPGGPSPARRFIDRVKALRAPTPPEDSNEGRPND